METVIKEGFMFLTVSILAIDLALIALGISNILIAKEIKRLTEEVSKWQK